MKMKRDIVHNVTTNRKRQRNGLARYRYFDKTNIKFIKLMEEWIMCNINQNTFLDLIIFFNEIMWLYVYQNWFNFNENNISVLRFFSLYIFLTLIIIENCWSFFRDTRIMNSTRIKKCYCLWMGYFKFNYICNLYTKSLWINIGSYNKSDRMQEGIDTLLNKFIKLLYYHFVLKLKQSLLLHAKLYISNIFPTNRITKLLTFWYYSWKYYTERLKIIHLAYLFSSRKCI